MTTNSVELQANSPNNSESIKLADEPPAAMGGMVREDTNTYMARKKRKREFRLRILLGLARFIPAFAVVFAFIYVIYLLATPANWSTSDDVEDAEILRRESARGSFVSVMIAALLNLIGAFMFYIKVKEGLVVTNYGFLLGPVIGYMLDQGVGTDVGLRETKAGLISGCQFTFGSLIGGNFMRYIVTVFLDLFISNPLQDVLKRQAKSLGVIEALVKDDGKKPWLRKYDGFVALNFPSILQSIVAFVTFNAYTNQTRFAWAYASLNLDRELRIPPGAIMLSTAISGVLYLNFYTIMDLVSDREYFSVNTKLIYVLAILGLLYGLNQTQSIEAPVEDEDDTVWTSFLSDFSRGLCGFLIFLLFTLYGFVYPVWTRLGCCGYCKPTERELLDTDHVIEEDDETLSPDLQQAVTKLIHAELQKRERGQGRGSASQQRAEHSAQL
eukprot:CAMPEP_0202734398 /NCGR_PEP_ID=MMETSP1385-20130828/188658_1 /ASSEMBLY_ACC=CAM_ASM_000861 /TAXON_ID=933848 /ORGANISM="Elphidium margaritaceum" /LENGTH=440 /DNA_ID=CAMNT_0049400759 /DNA_START=1741 /DNA_END=3063 /DNA_ORIENTATION=-